MTESPGTVQFCPGDKTVTIKVVSHFYVVFIASAKDEARRPVSTIELGALRNALFLLLKYPLFLTRLIVVRF